MRPARLVLNLALRKPTLRLVVKIWEPQFLNANITYINKKKALEYLQSSAPIAGSSNASELNSGSEDNDNSDNYNTESSYFRIANAHEDIHPPAGIVRRVLAGEKSVTRKTILIIPCQLEGIPDLEDTLTASRSFSR